ncbi:hypothetical protein VH86_08435 [Pantoea sp. BL1]|uniref:DUF1120 domain-containing protein n=1 Tax=Pantoea sp. BL1 TaxID=1628190 RepID=UPI0005F77C40|nr:DUF1120 domain-containing protein [Pantoea sp. BL1]KJV48821.1 hypothetical protein VH86_08435 [Pantoea sp. BL1]
MKMMQKSLLALAVLATTALNVQAASNVDVKVIGRIDPGTCTPTLSGGGTIDYGTMSPSELAATGLTVLPEKQLDFAIACTAPSKVAVKVVNGRPNTVAGAIEGASGFAGIPASSASLFGSSGSIGVAGLGLSNGVKVGGYGIRIASGTVIADTKSVDNLVASNIASPVWSAAAAGATGSLLASATVRGVSWAATGTTTPVAFTNLSGKLGVQAYLNEKSAFDLTNTVQLDGLSTIELVYLP